MLLVLVSSISDLLASGVLFIINFLFQPAKTLFLFTWKFPFYNTMTPFSPLPFRGWKHLKYYSSCCCCYSSIANQPDWDRQRLPLKIHQTRHKIYQEESSRQMQQKEIVTRAQHDRTQERFFTKVAFQKSLNQNTVSVNVIRFIYLETMGIRTQ